MPSFRIKQFSPSTFLCFPFTPYIGNWQHIEQSCFKYTQSSLLLGEGRDYWNGQGRAKLSAETLERKKQK